MHSIPTTHSQAKYAHTHRLTHRQGHHGLGLTAMVSVGQEECPCLVSPGAVCSPELSVSPLRANTLQAEWRRSETVPQTYPHIEDMTDSFQYYVIRKLSSRTALESAAVSCEKREEGVGGALRPGPPPPPTQKALPAALVCGPGGTPPAVFSAGKPHGQRSLAGCSPCGRREWDTTE